MDKLKLPKLAIAGAIFYVVVQILILTGILNGYFVVIINRSLIFVILACTLNLINGISGQFSLGHMGFAAVGAYVSGTLTTILFHLNPHSFGDNVGFIAAILIGGIGAAVVGFLIGFPSLRLKGDYLAIVTLGFGEIVPVVFNNSDAYTNGTNGITALYQPSFPIYGSFGFGNPMPYYITVAAIIAVAMILLYRLQDSRLGRAWMAVREDELAAASMGINTVTTKLLAFAIGASTSGLAGVYLSSKLAIVSPTQFGFTVSFTVLAMVVLGGMGNIWGVAAGAFVIYEIQSQGLKQLNNFFTGVPALHVGFINIDLSSINFLNYQYLLYGLALVGMMLLRPEGLFPSRRRKAELHDADDAGAANQELVEA
jgi:ABC-type branched-subunit amino acid transport system permease subunit